MYAVEWLASSEAELTAIWLAARDRQAITEAVDRLDRALRADPASVGESRSGDRRIGFLDPLGFTFRVDEPRRRVVVSRVWRHRR